MNDIILNAESVNFSATITEKESSQGEHSTAVPILTIASRDSDNHDQVRIIFDTTQELLRFCACHCIKIIDRRPN
jgi:hypothetical protein